MDSKPFEWRVQVRDRIKVASNIADMQKDINMEKGQTVRKVKFSSETSKVVHAHMVPRSCNVESLLEICEHMDEYASHTEGNSRGNLRLLLSARDDDVKRKTKGRPVYYLTVGALTSFKIRMKNSNGSGSNVSVLF